MSRLVVVSNRLADPRKTAAGGLAVALGDVLNSTGGLWFGWSGKIIEEADGGKDLDASALLMAEVNFIDPNDARFISTVAALEKSLCDGPYMRRYEAPDDFGKPETAFNICTFWRIDALARIGRKAEAREIFELMLKSRNPLGLLSEDTHPVTGEMWGNFPQTYSMVGIINAAVRLSARWDSVI